MAKAQPLSTKDLMQGFNVSHMSILMWRKGTPTKDPLPHTKDDNGRVSFTLSQVKPWAKKHGLTFTPPTEHAAESKPGPKAKVKGTKSKKPVVHAKRAKANAKAATQ